MAILKASRTAQRVLTAEFTFNFDDTMANSSGTVVDFGKTNTAATSWDIINLPINSVIVGGEVVRSTSFDTASYSVTVGDSTTADRYLAATDLKAAGRTALVPTGYVNSGGLNLRLSVTNADACTQGAATVRIQYVIQGRADEVYPN